VSYRLVNNWLFRLNRKYLAIRNIRYRIELNAVDRYSMKEQVGIETGVEVAVIV